MGISGKPEELVNLDRLSIPLIKRFSGGGTVVVDETPSSSPSFAKSRCTIYLP